MKWLRRLRTKNTVLWAAEIAGVGLVALAAGSLMWPLAALVAGLYLVVVANTGSK